MSGERDMFDDDRAGKVVVSQPAGPAARPRVVVDLRGLAARVPELRIGDEWASVFGHSAVTILGFKVLDEYPWPEVRVRTPGGREDAFGAPAFRHGTLVSRGEGESTWRAPAENEEEAA